MTTTTNDLIDRLVTELTPAGQGLVLRRVAVGAAVGLAASAVLMLTLLGARPDFFGVLSSEVYWLKSVYALLLAACGFWAVTRLSRPAGKGSAPVLIGTVLVLLLAGLALSDLLAAPGAMRVELIVGKSALVCPWLIVLLAAPVVAGLFWAMRGLAPTELRRAGFAAGLMGGAVGAWVYAFHCPESGTPFIALWYTAGIMIVGAIGLLLGPRLLRW
jgi:hypothetical protein